MEKYVGINAALLVGNLVGLDVGIEVCQSNEYCLGITVGLCDGTHTILIVGLDQGSKVEIFLG